MMRVLAASLVLALSFSAAADELPLIGRCGSLHPDIQAKLTNLGKSFTEAAALAASQQLQQRLQAPAEEPTQQSPSTAELLALVEGWLLKKEFHSARARREDDSDEGIAWCRFLLRQPRD